MFEYGAKSGLSGYIVERICKPDIIGKQRQQIVDIVRLQRGKGLRIFLCDVRYGVLT